MLHGNKLFVWSKIAENNFTKIKKLLSKSLTLNYFNVERKYLALFCDASACGLGVVLQYESEEGTKPIACWSRRLLDRE